MDKIQEIINEWDPIDLFPMAPKDEYIDEITEIYQYLNANKNVTEEKLAEKINEIFLIAFDDDFIEDTKKCLDIAKQIINNL